MPLSFVEFVERWKAVTLSLSPRRNRDRLRMQSSIELRPTVWTKRLNLAARELGVAGV